MYKFVHIKHMDACIMCTQVSCGRCQTPKMAPVFYCPYFIEVDVFFPVLRYNLLCMES